MKTQFLLTILFFSCCTSVFSQSTFEDAKNLVLFQQWYNETKPATDTSNAIASSTAIASFNTDISLNLAKLVLEQMNAGGLKHNTDNSTDLPGAGGFTQVDEDTKTTNSPSIVRTSINDNTVAQIEKEIDWYIAFSEGGDKFFNENDSVEVGLRNFPDSFKYLKTTVDVLGNTEQVATGTASAGLGGLMSISQSEILKGITNWALERAQKELMQAFLNNWLEKLESDLVLQEVFPNTLTMLSTKSLTTFFTDGDTWKATFQQDFDAIPEHLPQIVEIALQEAGNPIPQKSQLELLSGIATTTTLIKGISNNKRPEEILQLLSLEAFARSQPKEVKEVSIIDRTAMGLGIFINGLQKGGDNLSFFNPRDVLALSKSELQSLWKLLFLREGQKLKYAFSLATVADAKKFYAHVGTLENLQKLKLKLTQVSENIQGINTMVNKIAASIQNQAFTKESFHTYVTLSFELLELGASTLETLGTDTTEIAKIVHYRETYFSLFEQVSQLIEGIKTKQYGTVALNTVNLLVWIKNSIKNQKFDGVFEVASYLEEVKGDIKKSEINILSTALKKVVEKHLSEAAAVDLVMGKLNEFKKALVQEADIIPIARAQELLRANLKFTHVEQRTIIADLAKTAISKLQNTSEAIHKYGNLMVNIVMAEDSEDIENALEVAAMETGGYLIKQNSAFSATISFFPGIEYGWEEIKGIDGQGGSGSFIGATLPIGAEFSWATGWEKSIGAVGAFVQILDLGAVLNYSLKNDNDGLENNSDFGFKQVLSPGFYFLAHTSKLPITIGTGVSYSPALREVGVEGVTLDASALQWGLFIGVDLNVFTLFASDKKISTTPRK